MVKSICTIMAGWLGFAFLASALEGNSEIISSRDFSWHQDPDSVTLKENGRILWRFNYGPAEAKPCFHPVAVPGGPSLTWFRPDDHRWHRALWFSWKFINGVNYWEEDPVTGRSAGLTEWKDVQIEGSKNGSASISMDLVYRPAGGDPVMTEHRTITVSSPDPNGVYHLDWELLFQALDEPVLLDRTPLPDEPDGKIYGGYAGLSVRFAPEINDVHTLTPSGPIQFEAGRFRGRSRGMDYSGNFAGTPAGIAILDHPENLNAPSPWYAINTDVMHYFSPAVICYGPHRIPPHDQLTLRYRVVVHPGRWTPDRLTQAVNTWAP